MFNFNFDINKLLCTYPNESNYQNNETNPFTNENEVMPFPSTDHSFNSRDGPFYPSPNFNDLTNNDVTDISTLIIIMIKMDLYLQ